MQPQTIFERERELLLAFVRSEIEHCVLCVKLEIKEFAESKINRTLNLGYKSTIAATMYVRYVLHLNVAPVVPRMH